MLSVGIIIVLLPGFFPFIALLITSVILSILHVKLSPEQLLTNSFAFVVDTPHLLTGIISVVLLIVGVYVCLEFYLRYILNQSTIVYRVYSKINQIYTKFDDSAM